jgi:hypothetical protein
MYVANNALFDMESILWAANIELEHGTDDKPILPSRTDCVDEGLVEYVLCPLCENWTRKSS